MIKLISLLVVSTALVGCSTVSQWVPSFWDDNQSSKIIDIRQKAQSIDCAKDQSVQAKTLLNDITWFRLYSESKGSLQKDVLRLIDPIEKTVAEWEKRSEPSKSYCEIKKKVLIQQTDKAASAVLGRY